jgi:hypothetical protein
LQWYGKVPAVVNVTLFVPPAGIVPVSHVPSSLVALCGTESLFVQVTVVFAETVSDPGLNAKLFMVTAPVCDVGAGDGDGEGEGDGVAYDDVGLEESLHPKTLTATATIKNALKITLR